eukprot:1449391-Prorocentrum_lima.AAC.1
MVGWARSTVDIGLKMRRLEKKASLKKDDDAMVFQLDGHALSRDVDFVVGSEKEKQRGKAKV